MQKAGLVWLVLILYRPASVRGWAATPTSWECDWKSGSIGSVVAAVYALMARYMVPFAPLQLLGVFDTGRIEEFLNMRALSHEEMASPQYAPIVARTLRRFHSVQPQVGWC